jgi:uncharacterized protein with ParB-like and HNH nuclease domain/predicted transport protein
MKASENHFLTFLEINKHGRDEERYKLLLTQRDKETLQELTEDPNHAKFILSTYPLHPLLENYLYFENRLRQGDIDPLTIYTGISKLMIVDISLDKDHDNPQLIFESLNSTGMDLSEADLIRNYVLMGLDNEDQNRLYKKYWFPMEQGFQPPKDSAQFDRFMRDYLTIKMGSIPNLDKVYSTFKIFHRSTSIEATSELLADIERYARYFVNMAFEKEQDQAIRDVLHDINTLKVDVAYPFLLEIYNDYANKLLSHEDFITILRLVESYVFRRAICGIPAHSLNKTFAAIAKEVDKQNYLESVQAIFLQKDGQRRFPRDEEFRAAFLVKDVYNFHGCKYMLRKLENHRRKEVENIEECTIEHIMPQNERLSQAWRAELGPNWKQVQAQYLHTIGNLTLTRYNSEFSDKPFLAKRNHEGGFANSPVQLNKSLAILEHWNEEVIKKRASELADLALRVWPIPELSPEQMSILGKQVQLEDHLKYMPFDMKGIFERLRTRILNLDSLVREEVSERHISYKAAADFMEIKPLKGQLLVTLNVSVGEINDPKGLCKNGKRNGHSDEVQLSLTSLTQIEDVMALIQQAYEKHVEEVWV